MYVSMQQNENFSGALDEVSELEQCVIDVSCAEYSSAQSLKTL